MQSKVRWPSLARSGPSKYLIRKKYIFVYYHRYSEKRRQAADGEKQQIRLICYKSYQELLLLSGLETLADSRGKLLQSFVQKLSKNKNYEYLLPINESRLSTRNPKIYKELYAKTVRMYRSPLYTMRRYLNNTPCTDRFNNPRFVDLAGLFNDPFEAR